MGVFASQPSTVPTREPRQKAFILETEVRSLFQLTAWHFPVCQHFDKFRRNGLILVHPGTHKKIKIATAMMSSLCHLETKWQLFSGRHAVFNLQWISRQFGSWVGVTMDMPTLNVTWSSESSFLTQDELFVSLLTRQAEEMAKPVCLWCVCYYYCYYV